MKSFSTNVFFDAALFHTVTMYQIKACDVDLFTLIVHFVFVCFALRIVFKLIIQTFNKALIPSV